MKCFRPNFMNRLLVFLILIHRNKNRVLHLKTKLSDQSLAWLTSNVPLIFHISCSCSIMRQFPLTTANNCNRTYIIFISFFLALFCNVLLRKTPTTREPEECTWLLATNIHILLVRDSDVIWLQSNKGD